MPTDTWWNLPPDKRARITKAAKVEFAGRGFSAGSLNVISREAGIAKGSLFQYFADKLDFFSTICGSASDEIADATLRGVDVEHMPYFEAMRLIVPNWIHYFRKHPLERAIAFAAANEVDAEARAAVRSVTNEHYVAVFLPMAKRAADRGELRAGTDPEHVVSMTVLLMRHLNTAPFYPHADPILHLVDMSAAEVDRVSGELVDALERAYRA